MLIQIGGAVALSRLLEPGDFGLIAMVAVFLTFGDMLRDFGLSSAALQARELNHQQSSNLFWASWMLGLAVGLVLVVSTPLIVWIYGEPRLGAIVPVLAITFLISGAQAQIQVQLARKLQFRTLAASQVMAPAAGLVAAIAAAALGLGYWALVLQTVVGAIVLIAVQSVGLKWRPGLPKRGYGSVSLFVAGAQMGSAHLLTWAASNVDSLMAGVRWGSADLGYYNRSFQFSAAIVGGFLSPLTSVAVPVLNESRRLGKRPSDMLLKLQFVVAAPVMVAMVSLALTAPSLVPLLLGEPWLPAVSTLQILAVAECFHALSFVSYWGFLSEQLSKQLLYYNLVTKPLAMLFVIIGATWGIEGIAWGYVLGLAVSWPINLLWLTRTAQFEGLKFFANGIRILATAAVTYSICLVLFGRILQGGSWGGVIMTIVCATCMFTLLVASLPTGRKDISRMIRILSTLR